MTPAISRWKNGPNRHRPWDNLLFVRVRACAICGTDLKLATIGNLPCHPPRIIGHEMVGEIVHVGVEVRGYALGERITLATTVACGTCPYCALVAGQHVPERQTDQL